MLLFFPEIDENKTIKQAERKLKEYPRLKRMVGEAEEQTVTASYSFQPRSNRNTRHSQVENIVARKDEAERELEAIEQAVNLVSDDLYRAIIIRAYLTAKAEHDYVIYSDLGLSHTTYYEYRDKALVEFAEGYRHGTLLVEV